MKEITIRTIGWTIFGCITVIMLFGCIWTLNISQMEIITQHSFDIVADNQTKEVLSYIADIKKYETQQDDMNCQIQLLNQSKQYEEVLCKYENE